MSSRAKRVINMNVLPGEPLDGTGRACIHLFVQDEHGSFVEPHVLHPAFDEHGNRIKQQLVARPTRGRLACNPRRTVAPVTRGSVTTVTPRTDDPRAATCLKCISSREYTEAMETIKAVETGLGGK